MPTAMDTLTQLGQDLRDTVASVRGVLSEVRGVKDTAVTQTTTIINTFAARAPIKTIAVDPFNGSDANSGQGYANAMKSLDAAFALASQDYILQIYLFGDDKLLKRHTTSGKILIFGVVNAPGAFGSIYSAAIRKVSFAPEAANGPFVSFGRAPAGLFMYSGDIRSETVDFEVASVPAGLDYESHFTTLGNSSVTILGGTITANAAGGRGFLIDPLGSQVTLTLAGTVGTNAPGRIVKGVAAGANPNNNWNVRSNLAAA